MPASDDKPFTDADRLRAIANLHSDDPLSAPMVRDLRRIADFLDRLEAPAGYLVQHKRGEDDLMTIFVPTLTDARLAVEWQPEASAYALIPLVEEDE